MATFTINSNNNLYATTALTGVLQPAQFPALTGDVTTTAGNLATTIGANAVTASKFRQSAASTLVGNPTGATANVVDVTIGNGLQFTGNVLSATGTAYYTTATGSGTTQAMAVNTSYYNQATTLCTYTLPATANVGDKVRVVGNGAGGWSIAQNSGQTVHSGSGNTTTGTGGSLSSGNRYDCIELHCTIANTDWSVVSVQGNIAAV